MERGLPLLPTSVIEGVLDVTTVYYITIETRESNHPQPLCSSCQVSPIQQDKSVSKSRPVATVRPFSAPRQSDQREHESDSQLEEENLKQSTSCENLGEEDENISKKTIVEGSSCDCGEKRDSCITARFDSSCELKEGGDFASPLQPVEAPSLFPHLASPQPQSPPPPTPSSEITPVPKETGVHQEINRDPCSCHREKHRAVIGKPPTFSTRKMEVCENGEGCHEGQKYHDDFGGKLKENDYKETCLTECMDEFLEDLELTHLRDYLKVLGCTCVRDLKLLEEPELNAVQLISRRRLLKRLENMTLHHEAPPSDCSLEGWLTWYGLTHISGFLNAIGVLTVGDMGYLKEEDLELLKPVTRRRILSLYRK